MRVAVVDRLLAQQEAVVQVVVVLAHLEQTQQRLEQQTLVAVAVAQEIAQTADQFSVELVDQEL
jgi:hypothetical protein